MPRGTDSFEISFLARAINSISHLRAGQALSRAETAIATDDPNIRREVIREFRAKIEQDRGLTGNLRNESGGYFQTKCGLLGALT